LNKDIGDAPGLRAVLKELKFELRQNETGMFFVPLLVDVEREIERLTRERNSAREALRISEGYVRELSGFRLEAARLRAALRAIVARCAGLTVIGQPHKDCHDVHPLCDVQRIAERALLGSPNETEKEHG
jgi:hypothetical protein